MVIVKDPKVMLRTLWSPLARRAARAYVSGPAIEDALCACRLAARRHIASTIGFWNADHHSPDFVFDSAINRMFAERTKIRILCEPAEVAVTE